MQCAWSWTWNCLASWRRGSLLRRGRTSNTCPSLTLVVSHNSLNAAKKLLLEIGALPLMQYSIFFELTLFIYLGNIDWRRLVVLEACCGREASKIVPLVIYCPVIVSFYDLDNHQLLLQYCYQRLWELFITRISWVTKDIKDTENMPKKRCESVMV